MAVYFVEDLLAGLDLTESGLNSTDDTSDNSSQVGTSYLTAAMLNSLLWLYAKIRYRGDIIRFSKRLFEVVARFLSQLDS